MKKNLYWFRNDLRLHDNYALFTASNNAEILPVFIIDERELTASSLGFKKTGVFRIQFLLESLENLKQNLKVKGADLIVKVGKPENIIFELSQKYQIEEVFTSKAVTQEETSIETELSQKLKTINIKLELIWQNTMIHVRDLPMPVKKLPDVFTEFRKQVEADWKIRDLSPELGNINYLSNDEDLYLPNLKSLAYIKQEKHEFALDLKGGETAGLARLNDFLWKSESLKTYKETRNGLEGFDYSSKFSAWLSLGCLSPKYIYYEIKRFETEIIANESTYWLVFELLWRDYFYFISLKYGVRLFKRTGLSLDFNKTWRRNIADFKKWTDGITGVPFVDAFMRELNATGYMSNRGRQNAASYLLNDLKIEWWWGAMYFESLLIDYDVCANWGNWNYLAGIGNDPRDNRYFNQIKQAEMYDPEASFIKKWLPELEEFSAFDILNINLENNNIGYPKSPKMKKQIENKPLV